MKSKYLIFYISSLIFLLAASSYPIYMGIKTFILYMQNGEIESAAYPKYIIPYAPVCIAVVLTAALFPLLYRLLKRYSWPAGSLLSVITFLGTEIGFEQMKVVEGYKQLPLDAWQYSLCVATPEVLQAVGEPLYAEHNPAYKFHFYIIAILIVLSVISLIYGFTKMIKESDRSKIKPLITQAICVGVFIGLCVLACFTAFYRNGTLNISVLSAVLMSLFFIVFGVTFGVYLGCIFYKKRRLLSVTIPAVVSMMTTVVMYIGELVLTGGKLFKFGNGFLFEPIGKMPFAVIDLLVIFVSVLAAWIILNLLNKQDK